MRAQDVSYLLPISVFGIADKLCGPCIFATWTENNTSVKDKNSHFCNNMFKVLVCSTFLYLPDHVMQYRRQEPQLKSVLRPSYHHESNIVSYHISRLQYMYAY